MSVNRKKWHLRVICEDKAYHDVANGFLRKMQVCNPAFAGQIFVCSPAGGFEDVKRELDRSELEKYTSRVVLVLADNDAEGNSHVNEIAEMTEDYGRRYPDRVYFLGVRDELKRPAANKELGKLSGSGRLLDFGQKLASPDLNCDAEIWNGNELGHSNNIKNLRPLCLTMKKALAEFPANR